MIRRCYANNRSSPIVAQTIFAILSALVFASTASSNALPSVSSGASKPESSEASVRIRVESNRDSSAETGRKADATIRLKAEVEGQPEAKESHGRAEPISPVDTKAIDKATERMAEKIDALTRAASYWLGDWVSHRVLNGITWLKLLISLFVLLIAVTVERIVRRMLGWRFERLKSSGLELSWKGMLLSAVMKPLSALFWIYGTYAAFSLLFRHLDTPFGPSFVHNAAKGVANIAGALACVWLVYRLIAVLDRYFLEKAKSPDSKVDHLLANVLGKTIRVIVVTIGGLVLLQNVTGVNTGAVIASLGIGGLAFALAAKEPLTNIFGTFTILADKPFRVGEWIRIDNYDGFVESVGYRSTRIRTWDGYQVTVPNQRILTSNLENMATRHFTRWKTVIKLPYGVSSETLDRAVNVIREVLADHERMSPDWPPRVYFTGFDDWTLNIFISVWYNSTDWWAYYDWLDRTCRQIKSSLEREGIPLAAPPLALHMTNRESSELTVGAAEARPHSPVPRVQAFGG